MSIAFKCKMCGGALEIVEGNTICECEYCGTTQTVPNLDNEKKASLFNRANRLRMNNEFDKAAGIYESIVSEFTEEAEAYWGLCLCKYGIEYVDDPATGKKIPTCHRTSFESIFDDNNFELATEYADVMAKRVYRDEAKEIDRLQKAILDIAMNEESYDIFICYKETSQDGQRTKDSVMAQDIYDALSEKGYKVFFARITLEDKLGREYEPYIFSALNSAKVMLVIGTDYEHFNAVWVKNEWSRFLDMMKRDKSKVLIPCYADIDAYDMPQEFKNLQGQDMGKIGFIQDLVRGVGKIIPIRNQNANQTISQQIAVPASNISSLLERAFIFLEDENWNSADEYAERVLDVEPKNADAYLVKLMTEFQLTDIQDIRKCSSDIVVNKNYQRILKYGKAELVSKIEELVTEGTAKDSLIRVLKAIISNGSAEHHNNAQSNKEVHDCIGINNSNRAEQWLDYSELRLKNEVNEKVFEDICIYLNDTSYDEYIEFFSDLVRAHTCFEAPRIRSKVLDKILPRIVPYIDSDERILLYFDTGVFSSGKTGTIITDKRVISLEKNKVIVCNYSEMQGLALGMIGTYYSAKSKDSMVFLSYGYNITYEEYSEVLAFICYSAKKAHSYDPEYRVKFCNV